MARNSGSPEDPGNYPDSEPTQYADYGGTSGEAYSEYGAQGYPDPVGFGGHPTPAPSPWFQRPAALVGLGVLTAVVLAFLVYAVVKFTGAGTSDGPAGTPNTVPPATTTTAGTTEQPNTEQPPAPAPTPTGQTTAEPSPTAAPAPPPTTTPTTAETPTPNPTPSPTVTTSVTTVTETTTKRLFPTLPTRLVPPTLYEPPPGG